MGHFSLLAVTSFFRLLLKTAHNDGKSPRYPVDARRRMLSCIFSLFLDSEPEVKRSHSKGACPWRLLKETLCWQIDDISQAPVLEFVAIGNMESAFLSGSVKGGGWFATRKMQAVLLHLAAIAGISDKIARPILYVNHLQPEFHDSTTISCDIKSGCR